MIKYFVAFQSPGGSIQNCEIEVEEPISSMEMIRGVEAEISKSMSMSLRGKSVRIVSWQILSRSSSKDKC